MQKKAYAKFSISLQTYQLEFLKKMSGQQFNRPISQLISEAVNAMQKREMKKSKAAK